MSKSACSCLCFLVLTALWTAPAHAAPVTQPARAPRAAIVCPAGATAQERLAAREIRRYVYCRTGLLLPISAEMPAASDAIVVAREDRPVVAALGGLAAAGADLAKLGPQQYRLLTVKQGQRRVCMVVGGDDVGVLYAAYHFAEHLGVRFFLHGDVVPDAPTEWKLPDLDETARPLFAVRGVNPWGSHPFGFDAWNADDYKSVIAQLAKMRMNFIGMHCYPEGHPYAEPTVWHGLAGDFDANGAVRESYPASYYNTLFKAPWGGLVSGQTSRYHYGASMLFDRDDWAPDVMVGQCPRPATPQGCNEVFNRTAEMFGEAFGFARVMGVKTCIGTEAPLTVPAALAARLKAKGMDPASPAARQAVYEATFRRIMAAHPLDYYWIWTPEGWTWSGNNEVQYKATVADIKLAQEALKNVKAPFKLATAGWVLGPAHDRAAFDRDLPKDVSMSAISRSTGADAVDPAFGQIAGREKWAIPWLESDNREGLAGIQLFVGRMRRDAVDAAQYGCTGLMGLHWRTEILAPNVSALAQAAWDQSWKAALHGNWQMEGHIAGYPTAKVTGTADEVPYRTCRYDLKTITVKAPNGKYKVTLEFCEPHFKSAGERIFDVQLQGRTVLTNLDIFAKAGQFAALDFTFDNVAVTDGVLTIELIARKSLPCISAIAVKNDGFAGKINCGGPAYKDWQADKTAKHRYQPCDDFYADWARANFGSEAADDIAKVFAAIDGKVPQVTDGGCPAGSLRADVTPWNVAAPRFAFVGELEEVRSRVRGAGNLDRFDYWLGTMRYLRATARLQCSLGVLANAQATLKGEKDPAAIKSRAAATLLPAYREVVARYGEAYRELLGTVSTKGGLATVVYWEQVFLPNVIEKAAREVADALGEPLPADLAMPTAYRGRARLIVPTVRTHAAAGEKLTIRAIVLAVNPPREVTLHWGKMGGNAGLARIAMAHVARGVYEAALPPEATRDDLEYCILADVGYPDPLLWPATAPRLKQTVVILP